MSITHAAPVLAGNNARAYEYGRLRNDVQTGWEQPQYNASGNESAPVYTTDTWTYLSATTVTVPTDARDRYEIGQKVRFKQGGGYKYGYIIGVAATVLTITGGSDYTVANSAITDIYVSNALAPVDFPSMFNYLPTFTGFSVDPTSPVCKFMLQGQMCIIIIDTTSGGMGTSNGDYLTVSLPVTAGGVSSSWGVGQGKDNTSSLVECAAVMTSTSTIRVYPGFANNAWTTSGQKGANFLFQYPIV